ncbi:MAG: PQQ-binding-like beta-propeller repeat protein [Pirellulales bacterium]
MLAVLISQLRLPALGLTLALAIRAVTWADESTPEPARPSAAPVVATPETWPLFRGNPQATGISPASLPDDPQLVWKRSWDNASFDCTAAIDHDRLFVGDMDGNFFALSLADGSDLWKVKTENSFTGAVAVRDGLVYAGDADGKFHCWKAADGSPVWSFESKAEINSGANFYKDWVLVGSQDATLYCRNAKTGEPVWEHTIENQIQCSPTIAENRVFLAGCDGQLHIIDLDQGKSIGQVQIGAETRATPAVLGDLLFFGTYRETFYCVNWRKAEVAWTYRNDKRSFPFHSSAAVTNDILVVGGNDKLVHALKPQDGERLWQFATKGRVDSSPVVVGERVYVGSADGRLYGLELATGKKLWEYEAGGSFVASPAVASGKLVIANQDGTVYCFGKK